MARYRYTYKSFPNCPQATQYSQERESSTVYFVILGGWLSLGAILCLLFVTFDFFETYNWSNFLEAVAFVLFVALYDFYVIVIRNNKTECELKIILLKAENRVHPIPFVEEYCQKLRADNRKQNLQFAGMTFFWTLIALISTVSLIGFIKAIYFLCHKKEGVPLLFGSLMVFVAMGITACCFSSRSKQQTVKTEQNQDTTNSYEDANTTEHGVFYCRYCGTKISDDSIFCYKCGKKVR